MTPEAFALHGDGRRRSADTGLMDCGALQEPVVLVRLPAIEQLLDERSARALGIRQFQGGIMNKRYWLAALAAAGVVFGPEAIAQVRVICVDVQEPCMTMVDGSIGYCTVRKCTGGWFWF